MKLTHTKVSTKNDGTDATKIQPSDWNASHTPVIDPGTVLVEDDFLTREIETGEIGLLGWSRSAVGTPGDAAQPGITKHPGIIRLQSGAVSADNSRLHLGAAAAEVVILANEVDRFRCIVAVPTITSVIVRLGLSIDLAAANFGSDAVFFEFDPALNANWRTRSRAASLDESNNSTIVVTAGNWYDLEARRLLATGNWEFYINNALRFTHTVQKPTVAVNVGALVQTATTATRSLDLDYFGLQSIALGNRYT